MKESSNTIRFEDSFVYMNKISSKPGVLRIFYVAKDSIRNYIG